MSKMMVRKISKRTSIDAILCIFKDNSKFKIPFDNHFINNFKFSFFLFEIKGRYMGEMMCRKDGERDIEDI